MDMKPQVGETAGKVWELLSKEGPQTLAQLKKKVKGSGEILGFAIGWLARENQVEVTAEKKGFRIELS